MPMISIDSFQCKRCGICCKWEGPVRVSEQEISKIAAFLNIPEDEFIRNHTVLAPDRRSLSLMEKEDGSCVYYDDEAKACILQSVKPQQCKDFPKKWNFPGWDNLCEGGKALHDE
ncbi:MAG: YkgJ family cysteine cluster protein [Lentisphaeria bacterium]|nr:YkgJ family cysteine cluster protein [Lentisphaeria bacterium]